MKPLSYVVALVGSLIALSACNRGIDSHDKELVDSLNARAYHLRYVDVDTVSSLASRAFSLSDNYADGRNEARCNLAYVLYQQMDFDGVDSILQLVRNQSHNELLLLCADVLQMKATQRTGDGQAFYEAKSRAEERLELFDGAWTRLSSRERRILVYVQSEFHIIASTYYYYQEQDSMARCEIERVMPSFQLYVDTVQWAYYNYMMGSGGLIEDADTSAIISREFDHLFKAYMLSSRMGIPYFEANALQSLSTMFLRNEPLLRQANDRSVRILTALLTDGDSLSNDLPMRMCQRALNLFKSYDDLFQTACTYRTLGEIHFHRGQYESALQNYKKALHCVNLHHLRYYGSFSPDTLSAFDSTALQRSVELEWISDKRIQTVPEWIAGIRQQFSLTYSALDNKQASDYNRNFYLDLIQSTNQNLELENRTLALKMQTRSLYGRMYLSAFLAALAIFLFALLRYRLSRQSAGSRKHLQEGLLYLQTGKKPRHVSEWLRPYCEFVEWNNKLIESLTDECEEAGEQLQVSQIRVRDNKRKNAENRAKVSLVHSIVPFLDRIGGEVLRMRRDGIVKPERREYIIELVDQIEQHNQLLTEWIKMEQGALSLHVTTVSLQRLFSIVAEGHYAFDQKGVALNVEPTEAQVKADESLTLFMLNTLADNARKFTPKGGSVTLKAEENDEYVEVSVTDTGSGLTADEVETLNHSKVYDASQIGRDHQSDKGFGFGLMNCRGIIEKYKKTSAMFASCAFGVRSKVGQGSTFYFRLPKVARMLLLLLTFLPINLSALSVEELYDAVYEANVAGQYEETIRFAQEAIEKLNHTHPMLPPLKLFDSTPQEAAEMIWAQNEVDVDYSLIVELRNEVALAALALHDWSLYQYNNRACIRLHKYIHQDKTLPSYFKRVERTHRNSNLLLMFIILVLLLIVFLAYRLLVSTQVRIGRDIHELFDYCLHLLSVAQKEPGEAEFMAETSSLPGDRQWGERYRKQILEMSVRKANNLKSESARIADEQSRLEYEQNRLHVQNQVLDNCLSTIKHESMYYPSRIRQLAEKMDGQDIVQMSELVNYYHYIYTLLSQQADEQVSRPGFRRQRVDVAAAVGHIASEIGRIAKRSAMDVEFVVSQNLPDGIFVLADETLLDMLAEQLFRGMLHEGARISFSVAGDDRFVRFTLHDSSRRPSDEELANLFYPSSGLIPMLVAKQILREHDTYANHPGCRLVAQSCGDGYEIYFTLLLTS